MKCQVATCDGECGRDARYVARDVKLATCDEKGSETKDVHMCEEHMMPSHFGVKETKEHGKIAFFQESEGCIKGKEHDWSGWRYHYDHCDHAGPHTEACVPSGGEAVCVNCGMGAMHHSLMFEDE